MITKLTQNYKITCDRCGKQELRDDTSESISTPRSMGYEEVSFADPCKIVKKGGVCRECYKVFCEIAEMFFDEVNKHDNY